jgi:hypothetical protein
MRKATSEYEDMNKCDTFPPTTDKYDPTGEDRTTHETLEGEEIRGHSFDHSSDHVCEEGCDHSTKIDGGKLLNIFENAVTPAFEQLIESLGEEHGIDNPEGHIEGKVKIMKIDNPLDVLENDDFDHSCPVISKLEKDFGDNLPDKLSPLFDWDEVREEGTEGLEHFAGTYKKFVTHLTRLVESQKLSNLRMAYSHLSRLLKNEEDVNSKYKALNNLRVSQKYTTKSDEFLEINKAIDAVLTGTSEFIDAAKYRTHKVFAANVEAPNIRVAYTQLSTQPGEDFLMCPKGLDMLGYPVAMEISKCRDNCIDSRVNRETGVVTCGYKNWINRVADTNANALARLEVHRHPDNKKNLLSLDGKRGNPDEGESIEASLTSTKANDSKPTSDSREKQLEKFHTEGERLQDQKYKNTKEKTSIGVDVRNTNKNFADKSFYSILEKNQKDLNDEEVNLGLDQWLAKNREKNNK